MMSAVLTVVAIASGSAFVLVIASALLLWVRVLLARRRGRRPLRDAAATDEIPIVRE